MLGAQRCSAIISSFSWSYSQTETCRLHQHIAQTSPKHITHERRLENGDDDALMFNKMAKYKLTPVCQIF